MKQYRSSYVAANGESWLVALWQRLTGQRGMQRVSIGRVDPAVIHHGPPQYIWQMRDRATEARMLLRRHTEGKPTSRRAWAADGFSESSWKRARQTLMAAKVVSREGELMWTGRDATHRLESYLSELERRAWEHNKYVSP